MHTLLRITLLLLFAAVGIAVAVALALHKPLAAAPTARPVPVDATPVAVATPQAPVVAPYRDLVAQDIQNLEAKIAEAQRNAEQQQRSVNQALSNIQQQLETPLDISRTSPSADDEDNPFAPPARQPPAAGNQFTAAQPAPAESPPPANPLPAPLGSPARISKEEGDDTLTINVQNSDIRQVLELLSEQGGLNILAGKSVQGSVTAALSGVDIDTALAAILKSTGFLARREGNIVYVGSPADFTEIDQTQDRILTRIYRPNYTKAADLQTLFTPMLTADIGKITISSPSQVGIPADQTQVGGDDFAGSDVVIVRDYEAVLRQIDQMFEEVDVKPQQVAIEAMILSVKLSDQYKCGVNFDALRNIPTARLISGSPITNFTDGTLSGIKDTGGLKFGFLDSSLALFIEALETIGDTNVISSPRLTCLNKQRAEIQIGDQLGYISTSVTENSATQTVNFLDTGTLLRIRPHISSDGLVRLEVHPEISTGTVRVEQGMTIPNKEIKQVSTNILCPDACTVIIGGLISEQLSTSTSQIPLLGNLPYVGIAFRQKTEKVDRQELIVLITPRIVSEPMMCQEGTKYGNAFTQRQSIYFDKMSPIGKRNYGNHYLRLARAAYHASDYRTALKQVNLAIHFDPLNRDATTFRDEVVAAGGFDDESIGRYLHQGLDPVGRIHPDYSKRGYPWKDGPAFDGQPEVTAIPDAGQLGTIRTIEASPAEPAENVPPEPLPQP